MSKFLEGCEKLSDGRYRIRENVLLSKDSLREVKEPNNTLSEALTEKEYIKSYRFKIWQMGEKNLNNRNYDSVAKRVLTEQPVTLGLMDHPEGDSDGKFVDVFSVQSKPMIESGWLTVEMRLVGQNGRLVEEVLEKGGFIGVSSSCLGRVDEKGSVVADSSFKLERFGDVVLNPSNNFYHYKNDVEKTTESTLNNNNTIILENTTINNKNNLEENNIMMEDKLLRSNLRGMIREADKATSPKEKMSLLEEVLSYCDGETFVDLKESVESKIEAISEAIHAKAEKVESLEEAVKEKEEVVSVKESEVEKLKKITESIKADFNRTKAILEKQTEIKEELEAKNKILERDLNELMEKFSLLEAEKKDDMKDDEKEEEDSKKTDKDDDSEEKDEKKEEKKKESVSIDNKIRSFYIDAKRSNPTLREHRKEILACDSLKEAQEIVLKLSNSVEKTEVEVKHEKVEEKADFKSVASVTARFRENWGIR